MRVEIERVHLEEDTGKTLHVGGATGRIHGADHSLVDYNRAGIPLVEIVTKPVVGTGALAPVVGRAYVTELRELLRGSASPTCGWSRARCAATSTCRCRRPAPGVLGTRSETKNVNSLRSVERAIRYEMSRQAAVLDRGGRIVQETRHFHEDNGRTTPGRSKEEATDYRYFPEPDLVPLAPDAAGCERLRATLPGAAGRAPGPAGRRAGRRATSRWSRWPTRASSSWSRRPWRPGAPAAEARNWWLGYLAQKANAAGHRAGRAARSPRPRWPG